MKKRGIEKKEPGERERREIMKRKDEESGGLR